VKKLAALLLLFPTLAFAGRDASGNYTLPTGNPVVAGTPITASWANATLTDVATALSASLCRNAGCGGMNTGFLLFDGSAGSPGMTYTLEQNSGWYRAGAGDHRLSVLGTDALRVTGTYLYYLNYRVANWYDVAIFGPGKPAASQLLARIGITAPTLIQASLPNAVSFSGTNATLSSAVSIKKRSGGTSTPIGTITFTNASNTGAISFLSDVSFAAGDFIEFYAPPSQDATLADITITIQARRT